jgi:hypothetical protein
MTSALRPDDHQPQPGRRTRGRPRDQRTVRISRLKPKARVRRSVPQLPGRPVAGRPSVRRCPPARHEHMPRHLLHRRPPTRRRMGNLRGQQLGVLVPVHAGFRDGLQSFEPAGVQVTHLLSRGIDPVIASTPGCPGCRPEGAATPSRRLTHPRRLQPRNSRSPQRKPSAPAAPPTSAACAETEAARPPPRWPGRLTRFSGSGSVTGRNRRGHVVEGIRAEAERLHRLAEPDADLVVEDVVMRDHREHAGAAGEHEDAGGLHVRGRGG